MYVAAITAEIIALSQVRRIMGTWLCLLMAVFLVVSIYTSFAVLVSFVLAALASIPLRSDKYGMEALYNMFRPVRLWMEADRATLTEYADGLHIAGIMRVLDAKEGLNPRLFGAAA